MRAFPGAQQAHRPTIADGIGRRIEDALPAADDQNPSALQPAPARRASLGLRRGRPDEALRLDVGCITHHAARFWPLSNSFMPAAASRSVSVASVSRTIIM